MNWILLSPNSATFHSGGRVEWVASFGRTLVKAGEVMLVLSRKVGERIFVGEQVTITVVRITGGGVRLGIEAPPELPVVREELKDQRRAARTASANVDTAAELDP